MSFRTVRSLALLPSILLVAAAAAACGVTEPGSGPATNPPAEGPGVDAPAGPGTKKPVIPPQPVGPYTGVVGTTDVSILYPLPLAGASKEFVRPTEAGNHGALLPRAVFDAAFPGGSVDRVDSDPPSGYPQLGVVSLRLDPCSARGAPPVAPGAPHACRSEVRVVFQPLYDKAAGAEDDPAAGAAATDGGLHVTYDVSDAELVVMMKQILTLKKDNGDLALQELAPHPILTGQGLGGPFARGLRAILLEHLGDTRIGRVTFFDHNFDPDSDGWTFGILERSGGTLTAGTIPLTQSPTTTVAGTSVKGPMAESSAFLFSPVSQPDSVDPLVDSDRPAAGAPGASSLQATLDAALKVQNPRLHTSESTDCANCHLAEGARRLGEDVYGLSGTGFTHPRSLARRDERASVTNLHAFGYLHRQVAIMQRTANESVIVADQMEARVK